MDLDTNLQRARDALQAADALLIGAGAGMGVDSGLPDFRGNEGFWKAYPPFRGRSFVEMSNPEWFHRDPRQGWGYFGHRLRLYRSTQPHAGFQILRDWCQRMPGGYFVFTSNVDGHFQKAGFAEDRLFECHGSIHYLQCARPCGNEIWSADSLCLEIDESTIRCCSELPLCPDCQYVARPNVLMFDDASWCWLRQKEQHLRYSQWLQEVEGATIVAVEIGAGTAIPTVRDECERRGTILIRINPLDSEVRSESDISLPLNGLEALQRLR